MTINWRHKKPIFMLIVLFGAPNNKDLLRLRMCLKILLTNRKTIFMILLLATSKCFYEKFNVSKAYPDDCIEFTLILFFNVWEEKHF